MSALTRQAITISDACSGLEDYLPSPTMEDYHTWVAELR